MPYPSPHQFACLLLAMCAATPQGASAEDYSWRRAHATPVDSGDLQWSPEPFVFRAGATVRYIDYAGGDDNADGTGPESAWQHHPWDGRASGTAAACNGAVTYVFKRGVVYRCFEAAEHGGVKPYLIGTESGTASEPIRLTSSPDWGSGEAIIAGARPIPAAWQQAGALDVPTRMDPSGVWYIDTAAWYPLHPQWPGSSHINQTVLYHLTATGTRFLHLARDPDYQSPGENFASDYWHTWDGHKQVVILDAAGDPVLDENGDPVTKNRPYDDRLKGHPIDYFLGGKLWSHYCSFMGTPTARTIEVGHYNPDEGSLLPPHALWEYHVDGTPYFIEDLPQYLDAPGEFYYHADAERLFLRPPGGGDPNTMALEIASSYTAIALRDVDHVEISGLTFTRTGFKGSTIDVEGDCHGITVRHCRFDHLANDAVTCVADGDDDTMDQIRITDNDFVDVNSTGIRVKGRGRGDTSKQWIPGGELEHVEVLRNRLVRMGMRHNDNQYSNVPALAVNFPNTAEIAGNIIDRCFGSGIVVFGGKEGNLDNEGYEVPLTRILVHHNKVEHTALGVNDYGGLALWQGGPIYSYCNISGNAVGHWPGGIFNSGTTNLSYPIYLDGGFKIYNFNNITWSRRHDPADPYTSVRPAYFNVFGFLNQFVNNTLVGAGSGFGGTSGNRNDMLGNLLVDITSKFVSSNHGGNPSLIGGGDDAASGIDGAGTLAYGDNVFHGPATAGTLVTVDRGAEQDVSADTISELAAQMTAYPLRLGALGTRASSLPIARDLPRVVAPAAGMADFRPAGDSPGRDAGVDYFVPWSLAATVGEWHFNRDHRAPDRVLDFHFYMTRAHFHRAMYYKIPAHELAVPGATLDAYVTGTCENWTAGALRFDGTRSARVGHAQMHDDIRITIADWNKDLPTDPWILPAPSDGYDADGKPLYGEDQVMRYPGHLRKTLDMDTCNLLVETVVRVDAGARDAAILGKFDGTTGYRLFIDADGRACFAIASDGSGATVRTDAAIDDGAWHHLLAECDRASGALRIYCDGALIATVSTDVSPDASLSTTADFIVGADHDGARHLRGAIDFMRVCQATLADARTDIAELHAWQTAGPVTRDFCGRAPTGGQRDVGAIEGVGPFTVGDLRARIDIAASAVDLSWLDTNAGEDGVLIERATDPDFTTDLQSWQLDGDGRTGFRDPAIEPGVTYYYRVRVLIDGVLSPPRVLSVCWGSAEPALPAEPLIVVDAAAGAIRLDWRIADPADLAALPESWTVEWAATPGGPYTAIDGLTISSATIDDIDPAVPLHLRFTAVNHTGTATTQEFSALLYREFFVNTALDAIPADWHATAGAEDLGVAEPPAYLVSPSATPLLAITGWTNRDILWQGAEDLQYVQLETRFARGENNSSHFGYGLLSHIVGDDEAATRLGSGSLGAPGGSITLLDDPGEDETGTAMDPGEFWTLRLMTGPSRDNDPAKMDVYLQLFDQHGTARLDPSDSAIDAAVGGWYVQRDVDKTSAAQRGLVGLRTRNSSGDGLWVDSFIVRPFRAPAHGAAQRVVEVQLERHGASVPIDSWITPLHITAQALGNVRRFAGLAPLIDYLLSVAIVDDGEG